VQAAMGGINSQNLPIICGGRSSSGYQKECYLFDKNSWKPSDNLTNNIAYAAVARSLFPNNQLFMSGGESGYAYHNTVYLQKNRGWEQQTFNLSVATEYHCMVFLNSSALFVIGGWAQFSSCLKNTYIMNTDESKAWVSGPSLQFGRQHHSCSRIKSNLKKSESFSIVVAGGYGFQGYMSSVEVLDEGSNEWREGPDLPFNIYGAAIVEDPEGGVILIGGESRSLFHLSHVGDGASWKEMPQKLQLGRRFLTAMMIPDHIVNCTKD